MHAMIIPALLASEAIIAPVQSKALDGTFKQILQAEADVDARGDDRGHAKKTSEFFSINERGGLQYNDTKIGDSTSDRIRERTAQEYAEARLSEHVLDVHATVYGETAVVNSRVVMTLVLNGEPVAKQFRMTHVFIRSGGEWRLAARQETVIPLVPIPLAVNRKLYQDYVGRYRLTAFRTYSVTRDGDRLLWGNSVKRELVPESDATFVISGDQYRVTFVRGSKGVVTHLRLREFPGVEYSAFRVPDRK